MAINKLEIDLIIDFIMNLPRKAIITIAGIDVEYPISKTSRDGNKISRYILIEEEVGLITKARLVDSLGRDLETYTTSIDKGADGFNIKFSTSIKVEGEVI